MRKIPLIIHQTWKDLNIPEHYKPLVKTWKENHPGWEYILWTDKMNRDFIEKITLIFFLFTTISLITFNVLTRFVILFCMI